MINENVEQDTVFSDGSVSKVIEEETTAVSGAVPSTTEYLGKFKTTDELFKAYTNLEKQFTKKSQRLSELEKQKADKESVLPTAQDVSPALTEENTPTPVGQNGEIPFFEKEEWHSAVADFLQKNQQAKHYAADISAEILADANLKNNPNALELAWGRVVSKTFRSPIELAKDKNFLENLVLSSAEMKQKVMEIYLSELDHAKLPSIMGKTSGAPAFATQSRPQSLGDAKKYLEKILTN